ncbi:MAG: hypothetical protein CMI12_10840 [Oceanospirillum sp.]|nr:hypothetical protein [Oceanospirillum sp.]
MFCKGQRRPATKVFRCHQCVSPKKFKESRGHCYEIYGWNQAGQKVEVYFHPVTGKIMKQEVED